MRNTVLILLLAFTTACAQKDQQISEAHVSSDPSIPMLEVSMYDSPEIDHEVAKSHPYDAEFRIEQDQNGEFTLVTNMKLYGGSFFVSPITDKGYKGKFRVEVAPNDNLVIGTDLVETPPTQTVIDPHQFVNGPINWVTENTRYDHPLTINTSEDFQIGGKLIFVIEPKCTLEELPIMFKYKDGVLTVEPWEC